MIKMSSGGYSKMIIFMAFIFFILIQLIKYLGI